MSEERDTAPAGFKFMGAIGLETYSTTETICKNWERMNPGQRVLLRNAYFNHDIIELNNLNMAAAQLLEQWGFTLEDQSAV
jgi:hypothetical protein